MALEVDPVGLRVSAHGPVVGLVAVSDQVQAVSGRDEGDESIEAAGRRAEIAAVACSSGSGPASSFLVGGAGPGAGMGGGVECVDEPGVLSDGGSDAEGEVLGEFEGLEVVEHDGLTEAGVEGVEGLSEQEQAMSAETGAEAGDGGGGAAEGAGELSVGGSGL